MFWKKSFFFIAFFLLLNFVPALADDYYPGDTWRTSSPEAQGMDTAKLTEMLNDIRIKNSEVHSVLIIRHGYLVEEAYFHPITKDIRHQVFSTTKSFTSSLIAIALREKLLKSLDQKVLDFFPEYLSTNIDPQKKEWTIRHLLTMTSGMEKDNYFDTNSAFLQFTQSTDWLKFAFETPLVTNIGAEFSYSSINSHILSAIIQKVSGMKTKDFAEKYLFGPIGITDYWWTVDPQNINTGGWGLCLKPADMARLGYLYLKRGKWKDQQIIPPDYLMSATSPQVNVTNLSVYSTGYGYQFWINSYGGYSTRGSLGQYIITLPEQDMVIVFTGGLWMTYDPIHGYPLPLGLAKKYIIPSITDDRPIPENKEAETLHKALLNRIANPEPEEKFIPKSANLISGRKIRFNRMIETPLPYFLQSISLTFHEHQECSVVFAWGGILNWYYKTVLDGLFHKDNVRDLYSRGSWANSHSFVFETLDPRYNPAKIKWTFTIHSNEVTLLYNDESKRLCQELTGHFDSK